MSDTNEVLAIDFAPLANLQVKEALERPVYGTTRGRRAAALLSGETKVELTITFGDFIYDLMRIDPTVVDAADFARAVDLSDIPSFVSFADNLSGLPQASLDGNISQIQGYVAEKLVAYALQAQGAEVEFPSGASQPGYDLIVNGDVFQVKCWATPRGVNDHLDKYPDVPVFVNEELAGDFAGDERVIPIDGLKYDDVLDRTRESIDAGADALDFNLPLITTAISAGRNGYALLKGTTDGKSAVENLGVDVSTRTAGSTVGTALTGAALWGVGITAGWPTLILPLFGAAAGYEFGKRTGDIIKSEVFCRSEKKALRGALQVYLNAVVLVLDRMIAIANKRREQLQKGLLDGSELQKILWADWKRRIDEESDYRMLQRQKLMFGIQNGGIMDSSKTMDEAVISAMTVSRRAGVLSVNVISEHRELLETYEAFRKAMQKRLV
jgi:hypothetical protein